jgi:hypothetical protein
MTARLAGPRRAGAAFGMRAKAAGSPMSSYSRIEALRYRVGLLGFVRLSTLVRQTRLLRFAKPRFAFRWLLALATSMLVAPLGWWERLRIGAQIAAVRLDPAPVFIIGHWRSGTTHLHNLMSQDRAFGFLSMYEALVPECSQLCRRWLKPLLGRIVPTSRMMDRMLWPMDAPQEDEIALAKMVPYSFYTWFVFPLRAERVLDRHVLFNGAPPGAVDAFERSYRRLLQITALHCGRRRLLLKNPANTGRVRLLLRMFPDAKFIHIYRCPYDVYASTVHLYERLLRLLAMQEIPDGFEKEAALRIYEEVMRRFFEDRSLIPTGNLVEVCYEILEQDP